MGIEFSEFQRIKTFVDNTIKRDEAYFTRDGSEYDANEQFITRGTLLQTEEGQAYFRILRDFNHQEPTAEQLENYTLSSEPVVQHGAGASNRYVTTPSYNPWQIPQSSPMSYMDYWGGRISNTYNNIGMLIPGSGFGNSFGAGAGMASGGYDFTSMMMPMMMQYMSNNFSGGGSSGLSSSLEQKLFEKIAYLEEQLAEVQAGGSTASPTAAATTRNTSKAKQEAENYALKIQESIYAGNGENLSRWLKKLGPEHEPFIDEVFKNLQRSKGKPEDEYSIDSAIQKNFGFASKDGVLSLRLLRHQDPKKRLEILASPEYAVILGDKYSNKDEHPQRRDAQTDFNLALRSFSNNPEQNKNELMAIVQTYMKVNNCDFEQAMEAFPFDPKNEETLLTIEKGVSVKADGTDVKEETKDVMVIEDTHRYQTKEDAKEKAEELYDHFYKDHVFWIYNTNENGLASVFEELSSPRDQRWLEEQYKKVQKEKGVWTVQTVDQALRQQLDMFSGDSPPPEAQMYHRLIFEQNTEKRKQIAKQYLDRRVIHGRTRQGNGLTRYKVDGKYYYGLDALKKFYEDQVDTGLREPNNYIGSSGDTSDLLHKMGCLHLAMAAYTDEELTDFANTMGGFDVLLSLPDPEDDQINQRRRLTQLKLDYESELRTYEKPLKTWVEKYAESDFDYFIQELPTSSEPLRRLFLEKLQAEDPNQRVRFIKVLHARKKDAFEHLMAGLRHMEVYGKEFLDPTIRVGFRMHRNNIQAKRQELLMRDTDS